MLYKLYCQKKPACLAPDTKLSEAAAHFAQCLAKAGFAARLSDAAPVYIFLDPRSVAPALEADDAAAILGAAGIAVEKPASAAELPLCVNSLTKAGATKGHLAEMADIIAELLKAARTFPEWTPSRLRGRARVSFDALKSARARLERLAEAVPPKDMPPKSAFQALVIAGDRARLSADQIVTGAVSDLKPMEATRAFLLFGDGAVFCEAVVACLTDAPERQRFGFLPPPALCPDVKLYLEALSAGVIYLSENDPRARIDGPFEVTCGLAQIAGKKAVDLFRKDPIKPPAPGARAADIAKTHPRHFALSKPYFIGQAALGQAFQAEALPAYRWEPKEAPLGRTVLFDWHKEAGAKMVPFAGWEMPVQYPAGIFAEHRATRIAAGLFDVSHMSAFDFRGRHALALLESVLAGKVSGIPVGHAGYNYLLYPNGVAADDTYVYRLEAERFMLVVNAANAAEDLAWIKAAASGKFAIDPANPGKKLYGGVAIRDLREAGEDSVLDIALQGPKSRDVLKLLAASDEDRAALAAIDRNGLAWVNLKPCRILVSRTGYTGEPVGYELFVHPDKTVELWKAILEAGGPLGVLPAGLGARDAARLEGGLPLFGHELEGHHGGTLTEDGYGWVPKLHVPWFIGRDAYLARSGATRKRKMIRLAGCGAKSARDGHRILNADGTAAGFITSFAYLDQDMNFVALAYVAADFDDAPGRKVNAARVKDDPKPGEDLTGKLVELTVLKRFPDKAERDEWRKKYARE